MLGAGPGPTPRPRGPPGKEGLKFSSEGLALLHTAGKGGVWTRTSWTHAVSGSSAQGQQAGNVTEGGTA